MRLRVFLWPRLRRRTRLGSGSCLRRRSRLRCRPWLWCRPWRWCGPSFGGRSGRRCWSWFRSRSWLRSGSPRIRPWLSIGPRLLRPIRLSGCGEGAGPNFRLWLRGIFRPAFRSVTGPRRRSVRLWLHRVPGSRRHGVFRPWLCGVCRMRAVIRDRPHHRSGRDSTVCRYRFRSHKHRRPALVYCGELSTVGRRLPL